jgi:GNAT superfamily N-acetyltransferase
MSEAIPGANGVSGDTTFREMTEGDVGAGLRLCRAAGWNQLERDWRALVEPPSVFRVAARGGRVIGTAGAVVYGVELAWVCMVLVDPGERGQGLGTALVEQVLERLGTAAAVGLDATPSGRPVYARLGFAPATELARLVCGPSPRRRASTREPRPPRGRLRPLAESDLAAVRAWDREAFGADRWRLLRGAIAAAPEYAWVLEEDDALAGYCLGRPGYRAAHIGPVVALESQTARALVSACLASTPDSRFFLDAPAPTDWRSELQQLGFTEQRPFTRMYLPRAQPPGRMEHLFAIAGPEFG